VERLLADPATLAAAASLLLDRHYTPALAALIGDGATLDLAELDAAGPGGQPSAPGALAGGLTALTSRRRCCVPSPTSARIRIFALFVVRTSLR
jgi:hypothetical protein